MRWLRSAWTFVLAIVLALAFASTPVMAVDLQSDLMFTAHVVDLTPEIVDLPASASDVGTTDAVLVASHTASARSFRMVVAEPQLEDPLMFESAYHRSVSYHFLT